MKHWWWLEAWTTGRRPKRATFAVEAPSGRAALARVHELGYLIDTEDHVTAIAFDRTFEADYRLPLDCGGACDIHSHAEVTGNLW